MTSNESFKKRVRARMARTGEKYGAARRVLLDQAIRRAEEPADGRRRVWASEPELSDAAITEATGRGWDDWVDHVEAEGPVDEGRTAVARWVHDTTELTHWWSQMVTGGWERITGRRLPGQMPDGTFTANRSRTVTVDAASLDSALRDADGLDDLFPGLDVELLSRPGTRSIRLGMPAGTAVLSVTDKGGGRATVAVQHGGLPTPEEIPLAKEFWGEWLAGLDAA